MTSFVVPGQPVSANRRGQPVYKRWKRRVRRFARPARSVFIPLHGSGEALVYYFHAHGRIIDVDNILKGILDGMATVAFANDKDIHQVRSRRISQAFHHRVSSRDPATVLLIATAIAHVAAGQNSVLIKVNQFNQAARTMVP